MNRLAVVAVQEKENQLLCITTTDNATGEVEAAAVKEALDNWGISSDTIIASSFDTTSSNTGRKSGSTVLLQKLLNRQLLWLSCRHHIAELILKAAFKSLFGKTTAPSTTLFSTLKSSWASLDLTDLRFPPTPACYRSSVDPLLAFLDERLLPQNADHITRGDYKELLELAKVCLGGTVTRKGGFTFTLSKPGADSNARWMSKCLYILKFSLLQHQIPSLTARMKKKIITMSSFILYSYLFYWFTSPSLTRAASNDLKMFQSLSSFKRVNKAVSESCLRVLQRHTWYLSEDSIPFALFNPDLDEETGNLLAQQIGELPPSPVQIKKPKLPTITPDAELPDFVGPRSILLFSHLKIDHTFLLATDWRDTPLFARMEKVVRSLTPINDSSERSLALATCFNGKITRDEESFQNLMLVVAAHRKKYGFKSKKDLKSFV